MYDISSLRLNKKLRNPYIDTGGTRRRSWLRHYATSREVAGSIPDGVNGIFHWRNPSGRTMALGSTQPLTEMSTRNISWGVKAAGAYDWQLYHLHVPIVLKSESLHLLEPSGPVKACNRTAFASWQRHTYVIPEAVIQFRCCWWWAKISLETCRAARE